MSTDHGSQEALEEIRALVQGELAAVDVTIRERFRSSVALVEQVAQHIIAGGGKRLRPLMVVLAGRACDGARVECILAAAFIEFIHTATLLHDDVVDMSVRRRGRDTANEVYGNQASVLVGDFVYSRAFQLMAATRSQRVIEIMADATNTIAEGEVLQLMNCHDPDTSEARYLEVIYRKTARLFQAGGEVAAVVSGADESAQRALAVYGRHLGTAYQLIDDVLDYQSDPQTRGKNLGEDLAEGKPTLPLIYALRNATPGCARLLREVIRDGGRGQLDEIMGAIESAGGLQYTAALAQSEAEQALSALQTLPPTRYREALAALVRFTVSRRN
ncbi:MAG TPA: polyprenyl synthetase family protein [Steroidobacteraceae bacterium]|nr:polyprenyl synthetase family protein [Steroidobacteraceae bacterium]